MLYLLVNYQNGTYGFMTMILPILIYILCVLVHVKGQWYKYLVLYDISFFHCLDNIRKDNNNNDRGSQEIE